MSGKQLYTLGIAFLAALFLWASGPAQPAHAANCVSQGTGNWSAPGTWTGCGGGVPQNGDDVTIAAGHTVTVNTSTNALNSLTVNGILSIGTNNVAYTVTVNGDVLINGTGTIRPHTGGSFFVQQFLIGGNFTNNGSFPLGTGSNPRIHTTFNGTATQTISGSSVAAFYDLTVASGATVIFPATNIPTVDGTMINNGTVQQMSNVNGTTVQFLLITNIGSTIVKYRGVDITTGANLGSVTVRIQHVTGQTCTDTGGSSPVYTLRCYEITPTNPSNSAQVTLWALTSEQNSIPTGSLTPYRYVAPNWVALTGVTNGTGSNNYIFGSGTTPGFSAFLLGSNLVPTAVTLNQTAVTPPSGWLFASLIGAAMLLLLTGWQLRSRFKRG